MDPQNLQTASHYVNNLLLSRGLLRSGAPLEFADPSKDEGGRESMMAKVINLIHDMVLRRDRESDTLCALSQTMTKMRVSSSQQSQAIARLETRNADLERQLSLASAQERAMKSSLKVAESRNRALRDDMNRLKATVGQVRAQCANDVRRRDNEMARLKRYLEGRRGREGPAPVGITVVLPGVTATKSALLSSQGATDIESPTYSLKEETTDFLTQLSQDLSDENDALISLVQSALRTMRDLQGIPYDRITGEDHADKAHDANISANIPPCHKYLATDMDEVLEHLRSLLTNPSFVPLEEVEVREEEIMRLREGWDKMELRWREAISLMNSWRKRIVETGDTINLEDLRRGLNLDSDDVVSNKTAGCQDTDSSKGASDDSSISQHSLEYEVSEPEHKLAISSVSPIRGKVDDMFPAPSVLRPTTGNARRSSSTRKVLYHANSPEIEESLDSLADEDDIAILNEVAHAGVSSPANQGDNKLSQPILTVQDKLRKAEEEAIKALETSAARRSAQPKNKPIKRTAIPRKTKAKRRSTLSPEELEGLMGIS